MSAHNWTCVADIAAIFKPAVFAVLSHKVVGSAQHQRPVIILHSSSQTMQIAADTVFILIGNRMHDSFASKRFVYLIHFTLQILLSCQRSPKSALFCGGVICVTTHHK